MKTDTQANKDLEIREVSDVKLDKKPGSEPDLEEKRANLPTAAFQSEDDRYLAKLGYKSELYRGFNAFMAFTFTFTSVGVICSNALVFDYGLRTGGPVTLTWGWLIGSFFTMLIALSLAEITSTYPVSGSVYQWTGILAPKRYSAIFSYICGWFSFLGNVACDASYAYGFA